MVEYGENIPYTEVVPQTTREERRSYWETATGLQETDGLCVSKYANEQGYRYVEGELSAEELAEQISTHYKAAVDAQNTSRTREADEVSARMVRFLEEGSFKFSPPTLFAIHRHIFDGIFDKRWVGVARSVNLSKEEPVLHGRSVIYADYKMIQEQLAYDFAQEKASPYHHPLDERQVKRIADFVSNVWQTHPFREGNTRTIALFLQLYLKSMGVDVNNAPFAKSSVFFRAALVRANYSNLREGIEEDHSFIHAFFSNVVLGTSYPLEYKQLYLQPQKEIATNTMVKAIKQESRDALKELHNREGQDQLGIAHKPDGR